MRVGYLECFSGISGDMLLGALVDAGVPLSHLNDAAVALNVGARLEARKVSRGGVAGTKVDVITCADNQSSHTHDHGHAHLHSATSEPSQQPGHVHSHEELPVHEPVHTHEHTHEHEHMHSHDGGVVHTHPHTHEHSHAHAQNHEHGQSLGHGDSDAHEHDHHEHEGDPGHAHIHDEGHHHPHDHEHAHEHSHDSGHEHHRSLSTILGIIAASQLSADVKERASRAFRMLGEAEAGIHSIPVERVHFHEVGAVDTIVDIVCAAVGAAWLGVDRWMASPLNVGSGTVECAHGTLPVPAPATLALLGDAPVYAAGPAMERVTPTGATILRMLDVRYAELPAMRIAKTGYGAGGRDTPGQPNLLRLLVGEARAAGMESGTALDPNSNADTGSEPMAILETVIDDSTPQVLAYVSELLLSAGAWDVYRVPVQMKKGRTGVQLTVLASPENLPNLRDLLFRETTTIGLHWRIENKIALKRDFVAVDTAWGAVRIKVARWPSGEVANATPEYEDCRKLAAERSVPLKQVLQEAARLYATRNTK